MKKLIAFLCPVGLCLPLLSCSSSLSAGKTEELPLNVITCGDLAFAAFPL